MDSSCASGTGPTGDPAMTPTKRTLSDTFPGLEPSPQFRESGIAVSRDDSAILDETPRTPGRTSFLARGLSLQMPRKSTGSTTPQQTPMKTPLSPALDPTMSYGSPATSLPRHSRGLDFSRASTQLHHSTLAESSPDSSPIIMHKSLNIPSRKGSINSMMLDSPNMVPAGGWPAMLQTEKSAVSSSVGSVNMLTSPIESSASSDGELSDEAQDEVMNTPQNNRMDGHASSTPYHATSTPNGPQQSPGNAAWSNNFSPAAVSLMKNFQRGRFRQGRSRKSSSSASGASAVPSPRTSSPPAVRSIESANGYFGWGRFSSSRRESLALGTETLNLSSSNDSGDERSDDKITSGKEQEQDQPSAPGVVRRAVTRRGNLLPKTKGFARIKAALMEESTPVDADSRREAETIKQVRERDPRPSFSGVRSPGSLPTVPGPENALEDIPEGELDVQDSKGMGNCFGTQAHVSGNGYWRRLDRSFRTPPPPNFPPRQGSNAMDMSMDSPIPGMEGGMEGIGGSQGSEFTLGPMEGLKQPYLTKTGKRTRDEDVDYMSIKRRAVSPSLSVSNSPVVGQSPRDREPRPRREETDWGGPPGKVGRENSTGEKDAPLTLRRSNSVGSTSSMQSGATGPQGSGGWKRVGLQTMTDANDGLMKMSIE